MKFLKNLFQNIRSYAVTDFQNRILNFLEKSETSTNLLDCGCDDGKWTMKLGKRIEKPKMFGIEIVKERRLIAIENGIDAKEGDLNGSFPFPDSFFDIVHANQVIEHLADTDNFIKEIRRVLKPNGYAIICTENLSSWHNIFSLFFGWQPFSLTNVCECKFQIGNPFVIHNNENSITPKSWQHLRVFAYQGLKEVFIQHGFKVEGYIGSGYFPLPNFLSKIDPRHAAFLTIKVRKHK